MNSHTKPLPIWQSTPCPPWCTSIHSPDPSDQVCLSEYATVATLSRHVTLAPAGGRREVPVPVMVCLEADTASSAAARLVLVMDAPNADLSPAQARRLAAVLVAHADTAGASGVTPVPGVWPDGEPSSVREAAEMGGWL